MKPVKWIDRKFLFGYDGSYAPFFIERLRATVPRIGELIQSCTEEYASENYGSAWSIKQHIGHLTDLEKIHDGRIDDYLEGITTLRPADMTNKETNEACHNQKTLDQLHDEFRNSRDAFLHRLENLDEQYFDARGLHPRLKQMITLTDLLYFVAEHDNNHLTKIATIIRSQ